MIERIFKNWKSTLIGVGVLIFGCVLLYQQKTTLVESLPFLTGLYGLFYKEKKKVEEIKENRDEEIRDIDNDSKSELDSKLSEFRKRQR